MSSSVEVEKMKIEHSEGVRLGSMTKGQDRGVGSHDAFKLLNDENVELIKVTLRSPALMRLGNNR